jgi:hypothetical protein
VALASFQPSAWNQHVRNPPVVMESWLKVPLILLCSTSIALRGRALLVVPVAVSYSAIFLIPNVSRTADHPDVTRC